MLQPSHWADAAAGSAALYALTMKRHVVTHSLLPLLLCSQA
jgi:hypothetical protein